MSYPRYDRTPGENTTEEHWDYWIDAIQETGVNLTTWETEFVESVHQQRGQGRKLSDRQSEILERIYANKTP